jgi:hypothetical protein
MIIVYSLIFIQIVLSMIGAEKEGMRLTQMKTGFGFFLFIILYPIGEHMNKEVIVLVAGCIQLFFTLWAII